MRCGGVQWLRGDLGDHSKQNVRLEVTARPLRNLLVKRARRRKRNLKRGGRWTSQIKGERKGQEHEEQKLSEDVSFGSPLLIVLC